MYENETKIANIFTLTAIERSSIRGSINRTWGWYPTREEAEAEIRSEYNDCIFEHGSYLYAVIEETPPGFMGGLDERNTWWFRADFEDQSKPYVITALEGPPAEHNRTICFGMG